MQAVNKYKNTHEYNYNKNTHEYNYNCNNENNNNMERYHFHPII